MSGKLTKRRNDQRLHSNHIHSVHAVDIYNLMATMHIHTCYDKVLQEL